uniref:Rab3-GAP regulatory subunit N-terminal domain-containing protein n=1 Tax=Biomphalaria glabrata TaxID=6526 RepID=A0A2C9KPH8_BIOGL
MSCQLLLLSKFQDIASVRRFFFPSLSKEGTPNKDVDLNSTPADLKVDNDGWEQDWGFDDQEVTTETSNVDTNGDKELQNKWLQNCLLSLSPTNDVLAIAHENKICVLTQKWDPKKKGEEIDSSLTPVWEGVLGLDERYLKSLCPGIGTNFNGVLLLSQLLHMEKVERLKCRTYSPPRFLGLSETHDELLIMYTKSIVSIDGFSLVQSLRACCNQVARATASGTENLLQPPPLEYKKWFLAEQEQVCDYVACGVACANPFDQLKAASMLPLLIKLVALFAMANKIKSAILSAASGWLGFGGKAKEEKEKPPKIEPATPLSLRFGLPDKRRVGENIILSPNNNYAATTDSFGRVILIDVQRGVAVRMWKGYRDAQLGWVEVKEENVEPCKNHDLYRLAQFLIIYAPRRGILEVWLAAHGPRVAAFNVSKSSCLICPCYGMMGLNNVTCKGVKSKAFQCALIDPDGMIKTIHIPFHLALR